MITVDKKVITISAIAAAIGIIIGVILGHLGTKSMYKEEEGLIENTYKLLEDKWESEKDLNDIILEMVDPKRMENDHRELSRRPHLAGTERDAYLAEMIRDRFEEVGLDSSVLVPYNVLLSRPDPQNPNRIRLYDGSGKMVFNSSFKEEPLHPDDDDPSFIHAFLAYTPAGTFRTQPGTGVIYANYATIEDFQELRKLGINVTGHIVMARYGKIYRGNKVVHAEENGAVGLILFSDPEDVAVEGVDVENVYPFKWWLPGTGIQRGSTRVIKGDPLTPEWPSTASAYRIEKSDAGLYKIPAQPIGYKDARVILEKLAGAMAPESWIGGLNGLTYRLGPNFKEEYSGFSLEISTHNSENVYLSYNVIGTMHGDVEPGWRPRRTIVLCNWGAEEYGLIGSTEWVEIPGAINETKTVFDEWKEYEEQLYPNAVEHPVLNPRLKTLGSGSDHAPFIFHAGIPSIDLRFKRSMLDYNITAYPTYHTGYETFYLMSNLIDPGFKTHRACGRFSALLLRKLADSAVLPFSLDMFPQKMKDTLIDFAEIGIEERVKKIYANYTLLPVAVNNLLKATKDFMNINSIIRNDPYTVRSLNDQLMKFEQIFILPQGLPGRKMISYCNQPASTGSHTSEVIAELYLKHAVFAPSKFDNYATSAFPGITDLLHNYDELSESDKVKRAKEIRKHISLLIILTERATRHLLDVHTI